MPHKLDKTDLRILGELQLDCSISNIELAKRVMLSPSPTLARVRALETSGVIEGYVALVSAKAIGLKMNVFVQVSLERQEAEVLLRFENAIRHFDQILEVYLMTGDADYLLRIVVEDVQELEIFMLNHLTRVPGIKNIRSAFALKQVKYQTALPLPQAD